MTGRSLATLAALLLGVGAMRAAVQTDPAAAPLPPAVTAALVARLVLSEHAEQLDHNHLLGDEVWTNHSDPSQSDAETDAVIFHRSVLMEVQQTQDGKPLSHSAFARQQTAAQKTIRIIDAAWQRQPAPGRMVNLDGEIWNIGDFTALDTWTGFPAPPREGRTTVRLHFEPIAGVATHSRIERVLAATAGDLWVAADSGQILSGEFHTLDEVRFGAGILAHIRFQGEFSMQPAGACWVPRRFVITVEGRALLARINGTQINSYRILAGAPGAEP